MPSEFKFKVPRLFKAATKVAKSVKEEGSDIAELVNQYKKKTNVKALSALVQKVLENEKMLDQLIENTGILKDQKAPDVWLYRVLITELLLGKKRLPVGCKPIQTVLAFGPKLTIEFRKLKKIDTEESSSEASDDEAVSEEEEGPPQKKSKQQRKKKNKASTESAKDQLAIELGKLKKGQLAAGNTEESSDDEALSEEEERSSQKKAKQQKNKVSPEQPQSAESQGTGKQKNKTTPKKFKNSDAEEPKSATKKLEDYISIKSSNIKAKHGRNFGVHPKSKKFISPKQRNIQKVKQFTKRSHSQTPKGKTFGKDKPRYFEVPSSV